jgi:signal peptidase I
MLRPPSDTTVIRAVAVPLLLALGFVASFDMISVAGPSMEPTIGSGDRVLVFRGAYLLEWRAPGRGDIVLFENPIDGSAAVKRCVGIPGDRLIVTNQNIYLNGSRFPLEAATAGGLREFRRIPPDRFFFVGDNPEASIDSRHYGPVSRDYLLGKVVR